MDVLCIKMIANSKKLKNQEDKDPQQMNKLFQILEQEISKSKTISDNFDAFLLHFRKYVVYLVNTFEKHEQGKGD